jgi:hypothetical protein
MAPPLEVLYVTLISVAWFFFLYWLSWRCAPYLSKQNPPVALPLVVLLWTSCTFPLLVVWVRLKAHSGGFKSNTSWFEVGWGGRLSFFNISISTWYEYELLVLYTLGRTVLGSLISNVFRPLLLLQQSRLLTTEVTQRDAATFVFGQTVVTVFSFFSGVTDIYLLLTQIDLSIIALVATLLIDGGATWMILEQRFPHGLPERSAEARRNIPRASAGAFQRTLPRIQSSEAGYARLLETM